MNLTEEQAYPELPDYDARAAQTFEIGDAVRVGPGYQMGGTYRADGVEGDRFIVRVYADGNYRVAATPEGDYLCTVYVSRLVPRPTGKRGIGGAQ